MTRIDDLIAELTTAVGDRAVSYNSASAAWDIYEGYAFGLVIRAAVAAGGRIGYEDRFGNSANNLVFRTSPGMLYSTAQPYTHAVIEFRGCPALEAHIGVRVQGKSGVTHECDVLVLPSTEANLSRDKKRGTPRYAVTYCY